MGVGSFLSLISITPVVPSVPRPTFRIVLTCKRCRCLQNCGCYRSGEENGAGLAAHSCFGVDYELSLILKEIRVITDQVSYVAYYLSSELTGR